MLLSSNTGHSGSIKLIIEGVICEFNVGFPIINVVPTTRVSRLLANSFLLIPTLRNDTISLNVHVAYPPASLNAEIEAKNIIKIIVIAITFAVQFKLCLIINNNQTNQKRQFLMRYCTRN
jgi:hypothetical protein